MLKDVSFITVFRSFQIHICSQLTSWSSILHDICMCGKYHVHVLKLNNFAVSVQLNESRKQSENSGELTRQLKGKTQESDLRYLKHFHIINL